MKWTDETVICYVQQNAAVRESTSPVVCASSSDPSDCDLRAAICHYVWHGRWQGFVPVPGSDVAIAIVATITAAAEAPPPPPSAPPTTPLGERASFRMDHVAQSRARATIISKGDVLLAAELASMTAHEEIDTHGVFVACVLTEASDGLQMDKDTEPQPLSLTDLGAAACAPPHAFILRA